MMDKHPPQTDVLRERDAGKPKEVRGNAPRNPGQETDPQFPAGEHPANDQPLPGKRETQQS